MNRKGKIFLTLSVFFVILVASYAAHAAPVDVTTANRVAKNLYIERNDQSYRGGLEITETYIIREKSEAVFYIFNFKHGGFVIVSADDSVVPVLGYSFNNDFGLGDHPPQFDAMLARFKEQIVYAIKNKHNIDQEVIDEWNRLKVSPSNFVVHKDLNRIGPLLSTTWNQGQYYNEMCPYDASSSAGNNYVWAGCTATAMAQVMKYWNHPITGTGSHSYYHSDYGTLSANFGSTTYNWTNMPNNVTSLNTDVQTLLYHCGVGVEMDYGPDGSGAFIGQYSPSALTALESFFKYDSSAHFELKSNYSNSVWGGMVRTEIDNGRPLIYRGYSSSNRGGHAFNIDGYDDTHNTLFYLNWGWSGSYNGYYYLFDLTPGSHNYTYDQGAIFDLFPVSSSPGIPSDPTPADLSTNIDVATMITWTNGSNTDSVEVYFSDNQTLVTNKDASVRIYSGTAVTGTDPSGVFDLAYDTIYYWRVVGKNSSKASTDGPVWSFATESQVGIVDTLTYYPDISYYMNIPDGNGISKLGVYFTPADSCDLTMIRAYFYGVIGSPTSCDLKVYDALDDETRIEYPNNLLHTEDVPIASISATGWTELEFTLTSPIHFDAGENFFIIYEITGNSGTDQVNLIRSAGTTGGAEGTHSISEWGGNWHYHSDLWGTPFEMVLDAVVEYAAPIPPTLSITPSDIDFQKTAIDGYKTQTVTLENIGGGQVVIDDVLLSGDPQFSINDNNTYPDTLFNGESISFVIIYGPDAVIVNNAVITISETSSRTDHFVQVTGQGYNHNSWASGSPVFDQSPTGNQGDYGWSMSTSDAAPDYLLAENFWGISEPITAVEFWGINWYYDNGWYMSDVEDPMTFDITFYIDHPTEYKPDAEFASFSIPLSRTTVDSVTFSGGPVYKYRAELPTSVALTDGWVSIQGTSVSSPIDPWFLWSESPIGDHANVSYNSGTSTWNYDETDLAFALYTDLPLPPADVTVSISDNNAILTWTSETGMNYNVYSDTNPYGGFSSLLGTVTNGSGTYTDTLSTLDKKFYRVTTVSHQIADRIPVKPVIVHIDKIKPIDSFILQNKIVIKK